MGSFATGLVQSIGGSLIGAGNQTPCRIGAPTAETFLSCWTHPVPPDFIPSSSPIDKVTGRNIPTWNGWNVCKGAVQGRAPSQGCGSGCDCGLTNTSGYSNAVGPKGCTCAPQGALSARKGGGWNMASPLARILPPQPPQIPILPPNNGWGGSGYGGGPVGGPGYDTAPNYPGYQQSNLFGDLGSTGTVLLLVAVVLAFTFGQKQTAKAGAA